MSWYRNQRATIKSESSSDNESDTFESPETPDTPHGPIMTTQLTLEQLNNALASLVVGQQQANQRLEHQGKALDTLTKISESTTEALAIIGQPKQKDLVNVNLPKLELPRNGEDGERNFGVFFEWQESLENAITVIPYWDRVPAVQRNAAILGALGRKAKTLTNIKANDYANTDDLFKALRQDISGMEQEQQALLYLEKQTQKPQQDITAYHNTLRRIFFIAYPNPAHRNYGPLVRQFVRTLNNPQLRDAVYDSYLGQPMTTDYDQIRERTLNVLSNLNMRSLDGREFRESTARALPPTNQPEPMDTSYVHRGRGQRSASRSRGRSTFRPYRTSNRGRSDFRRGTSQPPRSPFNNHENSSRSRGASQRRAVSTRRPYRTPSRGSTNFRGNRGASAPPTATSTNRPYQNNAIDASERRRCFSCGSESHLVRECPQRHVSAIQEEDNADDADTSANVNAVHNIVDPNYEIDEFNDSFDFL